ncbi:unnamed protein product [Peronospora belbahrii]|uniref:Transmembrane protein n=1 Tax=Peronospora belbahrii TaxID=622444 RepID=A0AAU9L5V1_9STRA|nr:unnamed protein product [Peronospora belbahrii]CAH0520434.1 unnamed protein product [Peronospora belbahrii]
MGKKMTKKKIQNLLHLSTIVDDKLILLNQFVLVLSLQTFLCYKVIVIIIHAATVVAAGGRRRFKGRCIKYEIFRVV